MRRVGVDPPMLPTTPTTFAAVAELQLSTFVDVGAPRDPRVARRRGSGSRRSRPTRRTPADVRASADWCADRMRADRPRARAAARDRRPPVGLRRLAPRAGRARPCSCTAITTCSRSIPLDAWISPPFEPTDPRRPAVRPRRGRRQGPGALPPRGHPGAARLATVALPVNVKLLVEGEEEVGQPQLRGAARCASASGSQCDVARGVRHRDVVGRRAVDVHRDARARRVRRSRCARRRAICTRAVFGGAVRNAAHVAAELVADAPRRRRCGHAARLLRRVLPTHRRRRATRSPRSRSPTTSSAATPNGAALHRRGRVLDARADLGAAHRRGHRHRCRATPGDGHEDDRARDRHA